MGWNVRLFLLLIPHGLLIWVIIFSSTGIKNYAISSFYQDHVLLIRRLIRLFDLSFSSVPTIFRMLTVDLKTLILCFRVVMPPFLWMSQIFSEHLQPLCCPSHSRFLNSLMHLQNPFPLVSMFLYASSITLIVELRYSIALTFMLELLLWPWVS